MDFRLGEDQKALRDGVRSFCDGRLPVEALHELAKRGGFDGALWKELAELGVFSLRLPESEGGVGLRSSDAVVVFAELGRRLAPGPLAWTHLAAGLVPGAASGEVVVGGLDRMRPSSEPILVEHLRRAGRAARARRPRASSASTRARSGRSRRDALRSADAAPPVSALPARRAHRGREDAARCASRAPCWRRRCCSASPR